MGQIIHLYYYSVAEEVQTLRERATILHYKYIAYLVT